MAAVDSLAPVSGHFLHSYSGIAVRGLPRLLSRGNKNQFIEYQQIKYQNPDSYAQYRAGL